MPCGTELLAGQTFEQRKDEVRKAVSAVGKLIEARKVQLKVGPQGAVTFIGIPETVRARMTDACIYRMLSNTGSAAVKMAFMRAEQLAGRSVDRSKVAAGIHSHDGGASWHPKG